MDNSVPVATQLPLEIQVESIGSRDAEIADLKQQVGNPSSETTISVLIPHVYLRRFIQTTCSCIDIVGTALRGKQRAQVKGLGDTVAKTAEKLQQDNSHSEVPMCFVFSLFPLFLETLK